MSRRINVIFVHGWGMNSAVWDDCIKNLPDWMQVSVVDLPGHGEMSNTDIGDFETVVNVVAATVTEPVIWVGWSLGGLVCLKLAELFPEKVLGLCLVATNPCFVKQDGWQCAIDKSVFDDFSVTLNHDIDKTIKRFLALQVMGSKTTMASLKKLQQALKKRGYANSKALDLGLVALSEIDLRDSLKHITSPMQWILGARDSLVPESLADSLPSLLPHSDITVIPEAAHAPFLSHREAFTDALIQFSSGLR